MNIKLLSNNQDNISATDIREYCMPSVFEDSIDALIERLSAYEIESKDIPSFNPDDSFGIISSDRRINGEFGYIFFDRKKLVSYKEDGDKVYRYHQITSIIIDSRLYDYQWLQDTFHTIFNKIIDCNSDSVDVVWAEYNGQLLCKTMNKAYDIYDDSFLTESAYFTEKLIDYKNAPE